jgi:hypothetical protein
MGADPIRMVTLFWVEFGALFAAALAGGAAVLSFSLQLLKSSAKDKPLTMPVPKLLLLSFLQTVVLSAIAIGVGLVAPAQSDLALRISKLLSRARRFHPSHRCSRRLLRSAR